jgi:prepilin-type processing-associated H-X9-DG protein
VKIKGPSGKKPKEEIMKPETVFTKTDVIVTVGCIVFLVLNIAAVGPGGQRHAKEMLCLSQLHKWGEVFQDYLNDNGGYFMRGWTPSGTVNSDLWMEALRAYYKKPQMRVCPEATVPGSEIIDSEYGGGGVFAAWGVFSGLVCGEHSPSWPPATACDYGSYGINGYVSNPPPEAGDYQGHLSEWNWRVANVAGGDNIPLLTGSQWIDGWPLPYDDPPEYDGQRWDSVDQMNRFCMNRHRGYINSLFLDGSSRKVGLKELWTLKWHRTFNTCGPWTICGGVMPNDWPEWMQEFEDY